MDSFPEFDRLEHDRILERTKIARAKKRRNRAILSSISCLAIVGIVLSSPSLSEFVCRHPGLIAVLIGVTGEVYFDWKEETGHHARVKRIFMALLVLGLTYELYEASESDKEAANAIKVAGKANERAAKAELELAKIKQWRMITAEQKSDFTNLTHSLQKFPIMVRVGAYSSAEVQSFAKKIRDMLDAGGYMEPDTNKAITQWPPEMNILYNGGPAMPSVAFIENITQIGAPVDLQNAKQTLLSFPNYSTSAITKTVMFFTNTDAEQKAFVINNSGEPILVLPMPSPYFFKRAAFEEVQKAFEALGITAQMIVSTNIPKEGCEIFVNPK